MRTRFTWVWAISFIVICLFSSSAWNQVSPLISSILSSVAIGLVACSMCGRLWCTVYIAGHKNDTLVQSGPYSISRNPLYFFSWIGAIGIAMGSQSLILPLIVGIAFLIYYPIVISSEEAFLAETHPESFEIYRQKVPRFFPKWSLLEEPQEYLMKPVIFRRHVLKVMWFAFFLCGLELIHGLHACGWLPVYFTIY